MERNKHVLDLVHERGPIIPSQISGDIGTNILLASAILSELVSNKQIKISSLKIGGSPLYYSEGQEIKLQDFTKYLNGRQSEAYALIKERKVLRDQELTPVVRVALREIKDFAKPLEVSAANSSELFWKWYLLQPEETEQLIRKKISIPKQTPKKEVPQKEPAPVQKNLTPSPRKPAPKTDEFHNSVLQYFTRNGIEVVEQNIVKKKTEFEFVISFQTPIGKATYYCIAKNKKRCSDTDLNTAFAKGQMRKLPTLFLTSGEITKKATTVLASGLQITYKKI